VQARKTEDISAQLQQHSPTAVAVAPDKIKRRGLGRLPPQTTVAAGSVKLGLLSVVPARNTSMNASFMMYMSLEIFKAIGQWLW